MKKILFLFTFIFIFFVSVGFVCSADTDTNNGTDTNKTLTEIAGTNSPVPTAAPVNNNYTVTVSHNKVEHGKPITFVVTVKDSNGLPVANHMFAFSFRSRNDATSPDGQFSNTHSTDSNGVFTVYWPGNSGYFDYYDLTISDGLDGNYYPTGNVYYRESFDLTLKPTMVIDISKPTVYEGQYTQAKASVKINGNPAAGYLVWYYGNGKSVMTQLTNGVSVFEYNSYTLGNNPILVVYVGLGTAIPGYIVSNVNKTFNINVKAAPDLVISKVARSGNKYKVTITNIGNGASSTSKLKLWYSSKKYKVITVASLGAGKSKTYTVNFFKYNSHKKVKKYAQINYDKGAYETDYTNDKLGFKSNVAYGYCAELKITKVTRSGNNYIVTIKNDGKVAASAFKLKLWYGTKTKAKGLVTYTISKFGQFGNKLPPGVSIALTIPYYAYKTHSKYYKFVSINYDKKVPESNYANNLKKFKV